MPGSLRPFLLGVVSGSAATAAALWRAFPSVADRVSARRPEKVAVARPALIVNRWSGGGKADRADLVAHARAQGVSVTVLDRGDDLAELARRALDGGADAIGMAGGDGSLGLVAQVAMERGVPFFCVPVGTRNHFALDMGLKRDDPLWSLRALTDGDELRVDVGMATPAGQKGRVFLNNISFGIYALAVSRPEYRGNKARTVAAVVRELAADPSAAPSLRFVTGDGVQFDRTPLLLVSNNQYTWSGPPDFGRRVRLDGGELGALALSDLPAGVAGDEVTTGQASGPSEWVTPSLTLESDDASILAGVDGESVGLAAPVQLRSMPRALRVLVPKGTLPGYLRPAEAFAARLIDLATLAAPDEDQADPTGPGTDAPSSPEPEGAQAQPPAGKSD